MLGRVLVYVKQLLPYAGLSAAAFLLASKAFFTHDGLIAAKLFKPVRVGPDNSSSRSG